MCFAYLIGFAMSHPFTSHRRCRVPLARPVVGLLATVAVLTAQPAPRLTLEKALSEALKHNLGLYTERLSTANTAEGVVIEEAAFDWELFGDAEFRESRAAARTSLLDNTSIPESETRQFRTGAGKDFSTGTSLTLDTGLDRRASNNNAARTCQA
jgi:hypothetical protein